MSTNGSMIHENVHTSQVKEKKKSRALQTTTSKDRLLQQESRLQSNPGEEELDLVDDLRVSRMTNDHRLTHSTHLRIL